jgi:hypothetical protein
MGLESASRLPLPRFELADRLLGLDLDALEHPDEVLAVIEDKTESMVRELEQQEGEASRALKRCMPREVSPMCLSRQRAPTSSDRPCSRPVRR